MPRSLETNVSFQHKALVLWSKMSLSSSCQSHTAGEGKADPFPLRGRDSTQHFPLAGHNSLALLCIVITPQDRTEICTGKSKNILLNRKRNMDRILEMERIGEDIGGAVTVSVIQLLFKQNTVPMAFLFCSSIYERSRKM